MSDFEEDDDDLPSISVSQSAGDKSELEMPPASVVAVQRAREAAAERALQELRESYARAAPLAGAPVAPERNASQGSSSEEAEAALNARVSALSVAGARRLRPLAERRELARAWAARLPAGPDRDLLARYERALADAPHSAHTLTEQILSMLSRAVMGRARSPSILGAGAWLLAVAGAGGGARVRRALHALLDAAPPHQIEELGALAREALGSAERLLRAHDAARSGARAGADALAAGLLAAALARLLPPAPGGGRDMEVDDESALSPALVQRARAAWRRLPPATQLPLLRAAARALAAHQGGQPRRGGPADQGWAPDQGGAPAQGGPAAALLHALSQPLPRAGVSRLERQQVLAHVSKLQLLFGARGAGEGEWEGAGAPPEWGEAPGCLPEWGEEPGWPEQLLQQEMRVGEAAAGGDAPPASPERKRARHRRVLQTCPGILNPMTTD